MYILSLLTDWILLSILKEITIYLEISTYPLRFS